jgi:hypothetical protein
MFMKRNINLLPVKSDSNTLKCPNCCEHFTAGKLIALGIDCGQNIFCSMECADRYESKNVIC